MSSTRSERSADLVRVLVAIVVFGLFLAVAESYRQGYYLGHGYPANTFLYSPNSHFADFGYLLHAVKLHDLTAVPYPPFSALLIWPYTLLSLNVATALLIVPMLVVLAVFLYRQFDFLRPVERFWASAALTALSYPVLFLIDRANTEAWVIIAIAVFLMAILSGRWTLASVALGVAIALKVVPAILLLIFLTRRRWRETAIAIATAVALTLLTIAILGADTWSDFRAALDFYRHSFILGDGGVAFGSSIFGAVKWLGYEVFGWHFTAGAVNIAPSTVSTWTALALFLGAALTLFVWWKSSKLTLWQEVTLLLSATILLPHVSADYKLAVLLLPAAIMLREAVNDSARWFYVIAFGLLLIPKDYGPSIGEASFQVVENPLILIVLCAVIMLRSRTRGVP